MDQVKKKLGKSGWVNSLDRTAKSLVINKEEMWILRHKRKYLDKSDEELFEDDY